MRTGLLMDLESVPTGNEILSRITLVSRQSRRTFDKVHSLVGNPTLIVSKGRHDLTATENGKERDDAVSRSGVCQLT
jgi:hypothetical protein